MCVHLLLGAPVQGAVADQGLHRRRVARAAAEDDHRVVLWWEEHREFIGVHRRESPAVGVVQRHSDLCEVVACAPKEAARVVGGSAGLEAGWGRIRVDRRVGWWVGR